METSRGGARRRSAKILATKSQFTHSQSVGRDGTARCGESRHGPLWNQVSLGAQLLTRVGSPSLQPRPSCLLELGSSAPPLAAGVP